MDSEPDASDLEEYYKELGIENEPDTQQDLYRKESKKQSKKDKQKKLHD
jgi:hypothetical protein